MSSLFGSPKSQRKKDAGSSQGGSRSGTRRARGLHESGQATAEYMILLAMVLVVLTAFTRSVLIPLGKKVGEAIQNRMEQQFKDGDAMHRLVLPL